MDELVSQELAARVREARTRVDREAGAAQQLAITGQRAEAEAAALRELLEQHERVARLLTSIGEHAQESAKAQIEDLVTRGLQVIFGEELFFRLVQTVKGNQASLEFVIRSIYDKPPDEEAQTYGPISVDTPVLEARGGGMAVVVAFMLRLVVLLLTPGARRVLFLDESFAHVSAGYEPRVAEFLREVCDKAGTQIILITHSDAYADFADQHYKLVLSSTGVTAIEGLQREDLV